MKVITDTWQGLVRRRLWPVAVLLLAALVAVPFLLAHKPAATPAGSAAPATSTQNSTGASETLVALATGDAKARRRVLGQAKDPFKPAPTPKKKKTAEAAVKSPSGTTTTAGGTAAGGSSGSSGSSGSTGSTGSGSGSTGSTGGTGRGSAGKLFPAGSLTVGFGDASEDPIPDAIVSPLEALPSSDDPIVVYLGLEDHGKTAVFMLGDGVTADGDGTCDPSPSDCEKVRLKAGDTEFLTVAKGSGSVDYELDVKKIHTSAFRAPTP